MMELRRILAATLSCMLLASMSACGADTGAQSDADGGRSGQSQSDIEAEAKIHEEAALLSLDQIPGTTWATPDGTTYTFSTDTDPDGDFTDDGDLPDGLAATDKAGVYALYRNGETMSGNNGDGIWYSLTDYFPDDMTDFDATWTRSEAGFIFLHIITFNNDEFYRINATKDAMNIVPLPEDPEDGDEGFGLAFEELADSAQLNRGTGTLTAVD